MYYWHVGKVTTTITVMRSQLYTGESQNYKYEVLF